MLGRSKANPLDAVNKEDYMTEKMEIYLTRRIKEMQAQGANTHRIMEQLGSVCFSKRETRELQQLIEKVSE